MVVPIIEWSRRLPAALRPAPVVFAMRRCAFLAFTAPMAMLPAGLWAQSIGKAGAAEPTEEIRALERAFDEAIVRGDVSALDRMTSNDFTLISLNGELHAKADVLKYFSTHETAYEYRTAGNLIIRLYGDAAVVTGLTTQTIQSNGKDHSDAFRFTRVYIRQGGHWLLVTSQPTRIAVP